jgi:type II restriction/modification system DNA methylase subunit YeeA
LEAQERLLVRTFAPQNEIERRVVARLAEVLWRRFRLFKAQARWEADALQRYLGDLPQESNLSVDETDMRATLFQAALMLDSRLYRYEDQLRRKLERLLRYLLRHRAGRDHFPTDGRMSLKERLEIQGGEPEEEMTIAD